MIQPLIEVNANGERFNDETNFDYFFTEKPYRDQPGMWQVAIFDNEAYESADGKIYAKPIIDDCAAHGITDTVFSADTIEELAEHWSMDPATLQATIDDYNSHVDSGQPDEFGREKFPGKIETPPFWGIELNIIVATSKGGAKINNKAEVIDHNDQIIPGLYAAGESAFFSIHGSGRVHIIGGANGSSASFGRIAARSIAEA